MKENRSRERRDWTTMVPSDWLEMTPSDWLNMSPFNWMRLPPSEWMRLSPSEWMNRAYSSWNRSYADWINMTPSEWMTRIYSPSPRWREQPPAWGYRRHDPECECEDCYDYKEGHRRHHHGRCGTESCECFCCIGDVDLAVYAHFGEQRVIPLVVENDRHREAQITLELSPWTTSGGSTAPVDTLLLEPKTFTLPSCGEEKVTLGVRIRGVKGGEDQPDQDLRSFSVTDTEVVSDRIKLPDVDNCLVAFADLRLVGCDHRPLRLAVAVLPRSCDPYRVSCGCACC